MGFLLLQCGSQQLATSGCVGGIMLVVLALEVLARFGRASAATCAFVFVCGQGVGGYGYGYGLPVEGMTWNMGWML